MIKKCPNCRSSRLTMRLSEIVCKKCGYTNKKCSKVFVSKGWKLK